MTHELEVWLHTDRIGTLTLLNGRLTFCYAPDWLTHSDAVALSASLPLQAAAFNDLKTRPFFAGLLPEGKLRHLIAQQFQVSSQNDFALLDHIGGECAGAVTLLEPGQILPATNHNNEVQWLNDKEVLALLDELPHRPMLAGKDDLRLSLAGAQDKLPVVFDGKRIGLHAHAKNFSLLYSSKTPVLAPLYDTLSTAIYPTLTPKMAMKIGSKYKFSEVQARHWDQFADSVGLSKAQTKQRILALAKSLPAAAHKLQSNPNYNFSNNTVVEQIKTLIEHRCTLTIQRLTNTAAELS